MTSFVYFITDPEGRVKIGKADDVELRLKSLQTMSVLELSILDRIECSSVGLALKLERFLHKKFAGDHIRSEWFVLTPDLRTFIESDLKRTASELERSGTIDDPDPPKRLSIPPPELNEAQTAEVRETAINLMMQALTSVPNPPNFAELRTLYARAMLQACDGNKTHAALKLCIDRRTLYRLLGHS